jgi:hypothetical protein
MSDVESGRPSIAAGSTKYICPGRSRSSAASAGTSASELHSTALLPPSRSETQQEGMAVAENSLSDPSAPMTRAGDADSW